jgi:hypothetical protein
LPCPGEYAVDDAHESGVADPVSRSGVILAFETDGVICSVGVFTVLVFSEIFWSSMLRLGGPVTCGGAISKSLV